MGSARARQVYRLANGVLRRLCAFTVQNARRKQQLLDDWRVLQVPRPRGARAPPLTAAMSLAQSLSESALPAFDISTAAHCVQAVQRAWVSGKQLPRGRAGAVVVAELVSWQATPAAAARTCRPPGQSFRVLGHDSRLAPAGPHRHHGGPGELGAAAGDRGGGCAAAACRRGRGRPSQGCAGGCERAQRAHVAGRRRGCSRARGR